MVPCEKLRPLSRAVLRVSLLWALLAGGPLHGQTFGQLAPKPVGEAPAPTPPTAPSLPQANDDSLVLVQRLSGLCLVKSADLIGSAALPAGQAVSVEGLPWLELPKVKAISAQFLYRPLTRGDLSRLTRLLVVLCRDSDHPVVEVYVPPQDVSGGVVTVVVAAAILGRVRVAGNHWFADELFTGQVRTKPGREITGEAFLEDVDWLNQNPFRHVDLVYSKGDRPGETDALLRVADERPERVYGGYEDTGNQATGLGRAIAGFNLGNLWDRDNELSYQYTRSTDADRLDADSASYVLPLPWRGTLSALGSWARSDTAAGSLFNLTGITWQAGLRYTILLPVLPGYDQSLAFGLDYKWSNNNLGFGGTQVFSSPANIAQALVTYSGSRSDTHGSTHGSVSAYYSPGGIGGRNHDSDFEVQRVGATADYGYVQASFSRLERLPGDFTGVLTGSAQWSSARLLPSEQFGLGGEDSVRGYDERIVNGDGGISAQLEIRSPSRHLLRRIPDQTQVLVFIDAGRDWQHGLQPGEAEDTLVSAGPGLRAQVGSHGTVKADYGWQLERLAGTRPGRIQLSAVISF